jgi:CO/xanthine dehydrogenase FAD-binding subunit
MRQALSLPDALSLLAAEPGAWRPFAGGTDLMVLLEFGTLPRGRYLSIWGLPELRGIREEPDTISIGALATYTDVRASAVLQEEFPMLCRAAEQTGGIAIQNRGTLGGNIANASPAADSPPALLAYDAELEIVSERGSRRVPYSVFHRGYKVMDLEPHELIARIVLPRHRNGWLQFYRKVGTRRAQAISKVCFAGAALVRDGLVEDVRIALGSVAPVPLRCIRTEHAVRGRRADEAVAAAAADALAHEISPIDDIRSTAAYRAHVSANLLRSFLKRCGN